LSIRRDQGSRAYLLNSLNPSHSKNTAWGVLSQGAFACYVGGELISMLGTWMQQMAQGWVLAGLASTALALALVTCASSLPMLGLMMIGGTVADRVDKRKILFITQIVQALLAFWIGSLVARHQIAIWHLTVAGICLGVSAAFEMPAASALVPELVDRTQLSSAIAIDRSIFHATRLAGPALGGWLIAWLGMSSAFYANALSFGALMIALVVIRPQRGEEARKEAIHDAGMKEGLAFVRNDRQTLTMVSMLAIATLCISPFFMIMMPLYSRNVLHIPASEHGFLMGASGAGAFAGSIWLLTIRRDRRRAWIYVAVVLIVAAMLTLSRAQGFAMAVVAMVALTMGTSTVFGLANTIVQERAPDRIRGRVSAVVGLSFFGVLPFSGVIMSEFADLVGLRLAMGSAALGFGFGAALLLFKHRRCEERPEVSTVAPEVAESV
jgi:MFS family permease